MQLVTLGAFALENTAMRRARPLLLLTYVRLAGPVPRARLARLLWPHAIDERNSLREALHALRTIDQNLIVETPTGLASEVACDAAELLEAAEAGDDRRVAALHGGPFLASVPLVAVGSEFEDWVQGTGERIARAARTAHLRLARHALDAGDAIGALGEARAALGSEPLGDPSELETATLGALAAALPACLRDHLSGLSGRCPQVTVPLPGVIGRAREATAALEALAEPGAWLQVVGLPGIGKSTLGRLVLHHLRAPRPHLEARSVLITARRPSARDLLGCIAAALGLESSGSSAELVTRLAAAPVAPDVLVLDLEAHVADLAGTLAPVRNNWPHTRGLVLARRTHVLQRATTVTLPGLDTHGPSPSDAARLLLAQIDPDDVEPHSLAAAERLARACAGHPLLLRAVGRHVAGYGWDAAEDLARRWLEAGGPATPRPPLDELWRATVACLPHTARDALARLAVADRTWWSRAAVHESLDVEDLAILGGTGALLHGAHADLRLHPFVRAACRRDPPVARSRWNELRDEHARRQLAAAAADLGAWCSDMQAPARKRMDERFDDLGAALRRLPHLAFDDDRLADALTAIGQYCEDRERHQEGIALLTVAVGHTPDEGCSRAAAVLARAWLEVRRGGRPDDLATRTAATVMEAHDDPRRRVQACRLLGHVALGVADVATADARFHEGLAAAAAAGIVTERAALMADCAATAWLSGDMAAAEAGYRRSSELARSIGDRARALASDLDAARVLDHAGHTEPAMRELHRLERAVALGDADHLRASVHGSLAAAFRRQGELDVAYLHALAAAATARRGGNVITVVAALTELAATEHARGHHAEAGRTLLEAVAVAARTDHPGPTAATLLTAAQLLLAQGGAAGLARHWLQAAERGSTDPAVHWRARDLLRGLAVESTPHRRRADRDLLGEARAFAEALGTPFGTAMTAPNHHAEPSVRPTNQRAVPGGRGRPELHC